MNDEQIDDSIARIIVVVLAAVFFIFIWAFA